METIENTRFSDQQILAISVPDAAHCCGISRDLLWKIIRNGGGPPLLKIGRRTLVLVADLDEWLRAQKLSGRHDR